MIAARSHSSVILWAGFVLCFVALCLVWTRTNKYQVKWLNVPPAPHVFSQSVSGGGDEEFSYRLYSVFLQNFGDMGGKITPLKDYDYDHLSDWFFALDGLSGRSNYVPFLAAYYFSAVQDDQKLRPLIAYLEHAGNNTQGQKWRWLAQAVFLARFRLGDYDLALSLAEKLENLDNPDMPFWARHMSVYVMTAKGEKEAAYQLILSILQDGVDTMDPAEVHSTVYYLCNAVLDKDEAQKDPLCEGVVVP